MIASEKQKLQREYAWLKGQVIVAVYIMGKLESFLNRNPNPWKLHIWNIEFMHSELKYAYEAAKKQIDQQAKQKESK